MSIESNFKISFITLDQDFFLNEGKDNHCRFSLSQGTLSKKDEPCFKTVYFNKKEYRVKESEIDIFITKLLSKARFNEYDENYLKTLKFKILQMSNMEDICQVTTCFRNFISRYQKFISLSESSSPQTSVVKTALSALSLAQCVTIILDKTQQEESNIWCYRQLNIHKSKLEVWLEDQLKKYFNEIQKSLLEKKDLILKMSQIEVKNWTAEDVQMILEQKHILSEYRQMYILADEIFEINQSFKNSIDHVHSQFCQLFDQARSLPYFQCAQEAKRLGKIRSATLENLILYVPGGPVKKTEKVKGSHPFFIINNTFLKLLNPRAKIEEKSIGNRFSLSQEDSVVTSHLFKSLELEHLGVSLDQWIPSNRRYALANMELKDRESFASKLDDKNTYNLWLKIHANATYIDIERKSYEFFSQKQFQIVLKGEKFPFSFQKLLSYYHSYRLPASLIIKIEGDSNDYKPNDFFLKYSCSDSNGNIHQFTAATNYFLRFDKTSSTFFTFKIPKDKKAIIQGCEAQEWSYQNKMGEWKKTTFQTLYRLWTCQQITGTTRIKVKNIESTIENENHFHLLSALQLPVTLMIPELIQLYDSKSTNSSFLLPFHQVAAKPYLKNLIIFSNVLNKPFLLQALVSHLRTTRSEFKAFLVLLHQFLDLHDGNVGMSPLVNKEFQEMEECCFQIIDSKGQLSAWYSFFSMLNLYLNQEITKTTTICIYNTVTLTNCMTKIEDHPSLLSALNVGWELQIFDEDRVIAENENLIPHFSKNNGGLITTLLPIRNFLLALTQFKDAPLNSDTLSLIRNTLNDKKLNDWCLNKETFPWKFIKRHDYPQLEKMIFDNISYPQYTLSYYTEEFNIDIEVLNQKIGEDLSDLSSHLPFWTAIEKMFLDFGPNGWFKSHSVKLTSDSPEAKKLRMKIAKAILPKESWKQRQSRLNRSQNCQKFLDYYDQILNLKTEKNPEQIIQTINQILSDPVIPFSTHFRHFMQKAFSSLDKSNPYFMDFLQQRVDFMIQCYTPTYERLAFVMYPFLADVRELMMYAMDPRDPNFPMSAGLRIGHFDFPIENIIKAAREKTKNPETLSCIHSIVKRIHDELEKQKTSMKQ